MMLTPREKQGRREDNKSSTALLLSGKVFVSEDNSLRRAIQGNFRAGISYFSINLDPVRYVTLWESPQGRVLGAVCTFSVQWEQPRTGSSEAHR